MKGLPKEVHMRFVVLALLLGGCVGVRPVSDLTTIPKDTAAVCESVCGGMGLSLGAVVVIADQVGCVCDKAAASHAAGASTAALGAILAARRADPNREEAWAAGF